MEKAHSKYEHRFFAAMSLVNLFLVVAAFFPWFSGQAGPGGAFPVVIHIHAAAFFSWLVLFSVQVLLISANRVQLHSRLGMFGVCLAAIAVPSGVLTAIRAAQRGYRGVGPAENEPLVFLAYPLCDLAIFVMLFSLAIIYRRRPATHKRLVLLAAMAGVAIAAMPRLPLIRDHGSAVQLITVMFLCTGAVLDRIYLGAVHRCYKWAVPLVILSFPARDIFSKTETWQIFARWLTHQ